MVLGRLCPCTLKNAQTDSWFTRPSPRPLPLGATSIAGSGKGAGGGGGQEGWAGGVFELGTISVRGPFFRAMENHSVPPETNDPPCPAPSMRSPPHLLGIPAVQGSGSWAPGFSLTRVGTGSASPRWPHVGVAYWAAPGVADAAGWGAKGPRGARCGVPGSSAVHTGGTDVHSAPTG